MAPDVRRLLLCTPLCLPSSTWLGLSPSPPLSLASFPLHSAEATGSPPSRGRPSPPRGPEPPRRASSRRAATGPRALPGLDPRRPPPPFAHRLSHGARTSVSGRRSAGLELPSGAPLSLLPAPSASPCSILPPPSLRRIRPRARRIRAGPRRRPPDPHGARRLPPAGPSLSGRLLVPPSPRLRRRCPCSHARGPLEPSPAARVGSHVTGQAWGGHARSTACSSLPGGFRGDSAGFRGDGGRPAWARVGAGWTRRPGSRIPAAAPGVRRRRGPGGARRGGAPGAPGDAR